jgi:hypothetical protein
MPQQGIFHKPLAATGRQVAITVWAAASRIRHRAGASGGANSTSLGLPHKPALVSGDGYRQNLALAQPRRKSHSMPIEGCKLGCGFAPPTSG